MAPVAMSDWMVITTHPGGMHIFFYKKREGFIVVAGAKYVTGNM